MGLGDIAKKRLLLHAIEHNNMMFQQWASKIELAKTPERKALCERLAFAYKEIRDCLTEYGEIV